MSRSSMLSYFPSPLAGEGGTTCLCASEAPRKGLVVPGGGHAESDNPPPARVSSASSSLRADLLRNARDLPHKGGGKEGQRVAGERFR
jgi:hypothetical protein